MITATLHPNRITVTHSNHSSTYKNWSNKIDRLIIKENNNSNNNNVVNRYKSNFSNKKTNYNLSKNSQRNLLNSINLLFLLSKQRVVSINKEKSIYNYKASFVTLTLPAKQFHTDVKIKEHFSLFLNNIRNTLNINNYVWKCELQKNGNLHFHLVIDKFVNWHILKYYWNLQLSKLGYIGLYADKFSNLSLKEYSNIVGKKIDECKKSYAFGIKTNWSSPNTVSVNSIVSSKMLASYLGKYIVKKAISNNELSDDDKIRLENIGKLWGRSQSLSKYPKLSNYCVKTLFSYINKIKKKSKLKRVKNDFVTTFYIYFSSLKSEFYKWYRNIFVEWAIASNYPLPVPVN